MMLPLSFDLEFKTRSVRGESFLPHHLPGVMALEQACFPAPWSEDLLAREAGLKERSWNLVVHVDDALQAFFFCWTVADEVHLLNFAVHPTLQGQGLGGLILDWMCDAARAAGFSCIHLEVRESNDAAISLYESRDFATLYRRRGYYTDNGEDAIIMVRLLANRGDMDV
ncbi:MAG: ribosomal protein S18-alanine N-acetyltransferase [bacterium]|nr:ribosomal protein S18-alanine N-acetyltransferase [bacterium]